MTYDCTAPPISPQEQEDVQRKVDDDIAARRALNKARAAPAAAIETKEKDRWDGRLRIRMLQPTHG